MGSFLNGKKTLIGAIGLLLAGVGAFLNDVATTGFQLQDLVQLLAVLGVFFTAIGLGHKVEKAKDVLEKIGLGK